MQPIHPSVKEKYEKWASITVSDTPLEAIQEPLAGARIELPCGFCAYPTPTMVYNVSTGSIAGGEHSKGYYCSECGKYTDYSREFG